MLISFHLYELKGVASDIWLQYRHKKIWAFYGEMGSGKTTFISAICRAAGIGDRISSPTFSIANQYFDQRGQCFFHMDWYRLKSYDEAVEAGIEEIICTGAYCFIEWAEKLPQLLPTVGIRLELKSQAQGKHSVSINEF
jgi:tRNA threonylcarbamoyladenosine biosynthesis protein TsaE